MTENTAQLSTEHQEIQTNISNSACVDKTESTHLYHNLHRNITHQLKNMQGDITNSYTCGNTGGWRRVVYLDMTDSSSTCPTGWNMTEYSKRTCGRASTGSHTCDSVTFPVSGGEYSRVCGRIKAYQWGLTEAFRHGNLTNGVTVVHGNPPEHVWSFAAGQSEGNPTSNSICPCDASYDKSASPFVGEDYFCESGVNEPWDPKRHFTLHSHDTLWDGADCLPSSTCCSLHNPPYFVKQLHTSTTNDIEARICLQLQSHRANIAVELLELYVQSTEDRT